MKLFSAFRNSGQSPDGAASAETLNGFGGRAKRSRRIFDDTFEDYSSGLSRADRRAIVSGAFWVCLITMGLTCVLMGFVYSRVAERDREATAEFLNRVSAYLGSATEQEYSQFAQTLRHDLVVSRFGQSTEVWLESIPNTAETCALESADLQGAAGLVFVNTGEFYPLSGGEDVVFGYDEVSGATLCVVAANAGEGAAAVLTRGSGVVSVHRMKACFDDDCIRAIFADAADTALPECLFYDPAEQSFRPLDDPQAPWRLEAGTEKGEYTIYFEAESE